MKVLIFGMTLLLAAQALATPTVSTPGMEGPDTPIIVLRVCGLYVGVVEVTPEGKSVFWIGPQLRERMKALPPGPGIAEMDLAKAYVPIGMLCRDIREANAELAKMNPA